MDVLDQDFISDWVQYRLFLVGDNSQTRLNELQAKVCQFAKSITKDYIWNREPFNLSLTQDQGRWVLEGKTEFDDALEDEWFIVYILRQITIKYSDLYAQVFDRDGEFLLIEAAHEIPSWLGPENADNRVYIHCGSLYILGREAAPVTDNQLDFNQALDIISQSNHALQTYESVTEVAFNRIRNYQNAPKSNSHHAIVIIPRRAALVLHSNPSLVAPAAESFFLRDDVSLKACREMKNFPPRDSVRCSVRFTKRIYARLNFEKLIPAPTVFHLPPQGSQNYEEAELGMKIACGLEILCDEQSSKLSKDPNFKAFLKTKEHEGFFSNTDRDTAMLKAESAYVSSHPTKGYSLQSAATSAWNILANQSEPSNEDIETWPLLADDDSWMQVDANNLGEQDLTDKAAGNDGEDSNAFDPQENMKDIVDKLRKFMNDERAGMEGAEFDDEYLNYVSSSEESGDEEHASSSIGQMPNEPRIVEMTSDHEVKEKSNKDEPLIDEDDFFEFFLKEGLKLSPQDIEKYRATPSNDHDEDSDEDGDIEAELRHHGALDDFDPSGDEAQTLENLLKSIQSGGGVNGPAGALLSSLGINLPKLKREDE